MKKTIIIIVAGASFLGGCATIRSGRDVAVKTICENKDILLALAITNNDIATVKAIQAYCPEPSPENI